MSDSELSKLEREAKADALRVKMDKESIIKSIKRVDIKEITELKVIDKPNIFKRIYNYIIKIFGR